MGCVLSCLGAQEGCSDAPPPPCGQCATVQEPFMCERFSNSAARWWRNMRLMEKMRVYPNHSELSFLSLSEGAEPSQERQLVSTHRPHLFQLSGCHAMNQTEIPALLYKLLLHPNTVVL